MILPGVFQSNAHNPVGVLYGTWGQALFGQCLVHIIQHGRGQLTERHIADVGKDVIAHMALVAGLCTGPQVRAAMPGKPVCHIH